MTPAHDTLSEFILEAPAREVDAWWAEKGMDFAVRLLAGAEPIIWNSQTAKGTKFVEYYTDDRTSPRAIYDRVKKLGLADMFAYELGWIVDRENYDEDKEESQHMWDLITATNRQRILAAASAMDLAL